jgi:hypothetical protein
MAGSILVYGREKNVSTVETTLETEYRIDSLTVGNRVRTEWYMTLDPAAVPQVSTVTITSGVTNDDYVVILTVDAVARAYRHKQVAGDNAASIASFLATLINTHPAVKAVAASGVITITSLIPGQAFTIANTGSTTVGNIVIATTTANSGTTLHRKIGEVDLTFTINATGFPVASVSGRWYDAASLPVQRQVFGPLVGVGYSTIDALQTAAGISRPTND